VGECCVAQAKAHESREKEESDLRRAELLDLLILGLDVVIFRDLYVESQRTDSVKQRQDKSEASTQKTKDAKRAQREREREGQREQPVRCTCETSTRRDLPYVPLPPLPLLRCWAVALMPARATMRTWQNSGRAKNLTTAAAAGPVEVEAMAWTQRDEQTVNRENSANTTHTHIHMRFQLTCCGAVIAAAQEKTTVNNT
jgi:hypothetical protein